MSNKSRSSGLSVGFVLFLVFLVLKLTDNIDWSWWYVTMPLWIVPTTLLAVFFTIWLVGCAIELFNHKNK